MVQSVWYSVWVWDAFNFVYICNADAKSSDRERQNWAKKYKFEQPKQATEKKINSRSKQNIKIICSDAWILEIYLFYFIFRISLDKDSFSFALCMDVERLYHVLWEWSFPLAHYFLCCSITKHLPSHQT